MNTTLNRSCAALMMVLFAWDGGVAMAQAPAAGAVATEKMTSKEMLAASAAGIQRMRDVVKEMQDLLKKAEERGDAEAIQCVREKLGSSKALVDVSVLARNAVQEELASNSPSRAATEYRKITMSEGMVDQFLAEAMGCSSDGSEASTEVVRDSSGAGTGDSELGDLLTVIDTGDDPSQTTPYQ